MDAGASVGRTRSSGYECHTGLASQLAGSFCLEASVVTSRAVCSRVSPACVRRQRILDELRRLHATLHATVRLQGV